MRGYLIYFVYRLLAGTAGRLPPRAGYRLAGQVSRLLYVASPRLRSAVGSNMRHVLGPNADPVRVHEATREAFSNIVKGHYDLFRLARLSIDEINQITHVHGMNHLLQALANGRGVVVISAHLGNVDIVGQIPLVHGIQISGAVQHIQPEPLFRYLLKLRQSHGLRLIPNDEAVIGLFRALKRGEIIALPCDRDIADRGRVVEFFGAQTRLPDGPVRVALRTGAPMVPAFAERMPDNTFQVHIDPPLELQRTGDTEADVERGMELIVATLERYISRKPEQWLVATPVWPANGTSPA